MKIIIPAAGKGVRLNPYTLDKPKPILPIAGKTIVDFIIENIKTIDNVQEIIFIVGYLKDKMIEYVEKKHKDLNVTFITQNEYKGLAHAVSLAKESMKNDDEIFIILGDTIFSADIKTVVENKKNSLGVCEVDNPSRFGVAVMKDDRITELVEKPESPVSNLALAGLYYINKSKALFDAIDYIISNEIKTKNEYQLTDALQYMIKQGEYFTTFNLSGWFDCGEKNAMIETNRKIIKHSVRTENIKNSVVLEPSCIAEEAVIENSVIGPYASIGKNACVFSCVVRDSILYDNVKKSDSVIIEDMIKE